MPTTKSQNADMANNPTRRGIAVRAVLAAGVGGFSAQSSFAKTTGGLPDKPDRKSMIELPPNASEEIARVAVCDIVQRERAARDLQRWDELASLYNPDAQVDISWFKGSGAQFVIASRKMAASGIMSFHEMGGTVATVKGNRALADTSCAIHLLGSVQGIEVDVIGYSRLRARVERKSDRWLMSGFRVVYIRDMMIPLDPTRAPKLEPKVLAAYRPSYRFLSFMLGENGHAPRSDLPGVDQPKIVDALVNGEEKWLAGQA